MLFIGPGEKEQIARGRAELEAPGMWRRAEQPFVPGALEPFVVRLPVGWRCAYSIDSVPGATPASPRVLTRHLSVSCEGGVPSAYAMEMIAAEYGFGAGATMGTLPSDPPSVIHAIERFVLPGAP